MLSTFALQRLEEALRVDLNTSDGVTEYLDRVAKPAVTAAPPRAEITQRRAEVPSPLSHDEPGLPTRSYAHAGSNPQFHRTQYANRV